MGFWIELLVIIALTIINGVLAMSELAIASSKRVRLQQLADEGNQGALRALELSASPNRFLSTVQIGITLVGIMMGAFAGATLSKELAGLIARVPLLAGVSEVIALILVVMFSTYISLVIGELVPKRLAMQNPERFASLVAPSMIRLSLLTSPFVYILSISTDAALRLLRAQNMDEHPVTEEEIQALLQQGIQGGVFEPRERDMIAGVFSLDNRRVTALMTPRTEVEWLNLDDPLEVNLQKIKRSHHSQYPVAHGSLDKIEGVIRAKDLLNRVLSGQSVDFEAELHEALFVPETATASHVLELFKQSRNHIALVLSEYGGIEGLVTLNNLIEQIIGEIDDPQAVKRADGSWLLDGLLPIADVKQIFDLKTLIGEQEGHYETLGGFMMTTLGRIPNLTDVIEAEGLRFEVVDMDGRRVDKVLVQRIRSSETQGMNIVIQRSDDKE